MVEHRIGALLEEAGHSALGLGPPVYYANSIDQLTSRDNVRMLCLNPMLVDIIVNQLVVRFLANLADLAACLPIRAWLVSFRLSEIQIHLARDLIGASQSEVRLEISERPGLTSGAPLLCKHPYKHCASAFPRSPTRPLGTATSRAWIPLD